MTKEVRLSQRLGLTEASAINSGAVCLDWPWTFNRCSVLLYVYISFYHLCIIAASMFFVLLSDRRITNVFTMMVTVVKVKSRALV